MSLQVTFQKTKKIIKKIYLSKIKQTFQRIKK